MLSFTGALKVYAALEPQDMRKSFNGLTAVVEQHLKSDPYQGALYLFTNKRRNRIKILFWDGTGLWVAAKRLEKGCFSWPAPSQKGQRRLNLAPEALSMLTDGGGSEGSKDASVVRTGVKKCAKVFAFICNVWLTLLHE